jgi:hypothetical protein
MPQPTTRTQILSDLAHPDWNPISESHGIGHDAATALVDRHTAETRAAAYREAADLAENLRQFEHATGPRKDAQISENVGILRVADALRAKADEVHPA